MPLFFSWSARDWPVDWNVSSDRKNKELRDYQRSIRRGGQRRDVPGRCDDIVAFSSTTRVRNSDALEIEQSYQNSHEVTPRRTKDRINDGKDLVIHWESTISGGWVRCHQGNGIFSMILLVNRSPPSASKQMRLHDERRQTAWFLCVLNICHVAATSVVSVFPMSLFINRL